GGAAGTASRAELGHIADTGRGAAFGRARLEGVRRAVGAGPGTELGDVAGAGGRATLRGARLHHVGRAVVGGAVAALGGVAVAGRGPADGRALRVGGAGGGAPGAELGHVADTGRGAALGRARLEGVGRAVVRGPVAPLGDVAVPRCRAADGRALRVRGAVDTTARAELG